MMVHAYTTLLSIGGAEDDAVDVDDDGITFEALIEATAGDMVGDSAAAGDNSFDELGFGGEA